MALTDLIADHPLTTEHLRHIARSIERYLGSLCSVVRNTRCRVLRTNQRRAVSDALNFFAGPRTAHEACLRQLLPDIGSSSAGCANGRLLNEYYEQAAMHHARVDELAHRWLATGPLNDAESLELRAQLDALQNVYPRLLMLEEQLVYPVLLAQHPAD